MVVQEQLETENLLLFSVSVVWLFADEYHQNPKGNNQGVKITVIDVAPVHKSPVFDASDFHYYFLDTVVLYDSFAVAIPHYMGYPCIYILLRN